MKTMAATEVITERQLGLIMELTVSAHELGLSGSRTENFSDLLPFYHQTSLASRA